MNPPKTKGIVTFYSQDNKLEIQWETRRGKENGHRKNPVSAERLFD